MRVKGTKTQRFHEGEQSHPPCGGKTLLKVIKKNDKPDLLAPDSSSYLKAVSFRSLAYSHISKLAHSNRYFPPPALISDFHSAGKAISA